jgi:hypothetical protein
MAWAFTNTEDITRRVKVEKLRVCAFGAFEPVEGVVEVPGFFTAVLDAVDITKAVVAVVPLDQHLKGSDPNTASLRKYYN